MVTPSSVISQYLEKYSESETHEWRLSSFSSDSFSFGLALPLKGESFQDVERLLLSLQSCSPKEGPVLVVAVINGLHTPSDPHFKANQALLQRAQECSSFQYKHFLFEDFSPQLKILWLDRFLASPFKEKEGVGLARKIGCDLILDLFSRGQITSEWIWTSDADARVPNDYFSLQDIPPKTTAIHYRYRHHSTDFLGEEALTLYEIHLRYYLLGLRHSGSPYAFPTIGSCLALHTDAYAKVRGFPNRSAGEDFHLLNKLRKVGPIFSTPQGNPVVLNGRFSKRVPFGTGRATQDIFEQLGNGADFSLYHPQCFVWLEEFLRRIHHFLKTLEEPLESFLKNLSAAFPSGPALFETVPIRELLADSLKRKDSSNRLRHFATAFDALKTLRLIRFFDRTFPRKLSWREALSSAPFLEGIAELSQIRSPQEALFVLQAREESNISQRRTQDFYL